MKGKKLCSWWKAARVSIVLLPAWNETLEGSKEIGFDVNGYEGKCWVLE